MAQQPPVDQGLLILEVYRSHTTLKTDRHPCRHGGIRIHSPSRRAAADPRLRPRGHWVYDHTQNKLQVSCRVTLCLRASSCRRFETPVTACSKIKNHAPEDSNLQQYRCDNHKSHTIPTRQFISYFAQETLRPPPCCLLFYVIALSL